MTCSGRYATAAQYESVMCSGADLTEPTELAAIEAFLDIAASDVHAALAAVGACDCTLASWAGVYLAKLNIVDAAVLQNCPCGNMTDEQKATWLAWLEKQYELIRSGQVPVCEDETGSLYPAFGIVQQSLTEWNTENIIINEVMKLP